MKKASLRGLLIFSLAGLSGSALFWTSQHVQKAEDELRAVQVSVQKEQETIRVLGAEWAYLNSPGRLEILAQEYLNIEPAGPGEIISDSAVLPTPALSSQQGSVFHEISTAAPPEGQSSTIFVTPNKKPVRKQKPGKNFNALLNELSGGEPKP